MDPPDDEFRANGGPALRRGASSKTDGGRAGRAGEETTAEPSLASAFRGRPYKPEDDDVDDDEDAASCATSDAGSVANYSVGSSVPDRYGFTGGFQYCGDKSVFCN